LNTCDVEGKVALAAEYWNLLLERSGTAAMLKHPPIIVQSNGSEMNGV
jgi:hypothetical protein